MNGYETTPEFQSTPPRGWRHLSTSTVAIVSIISIHSTARVETPVPLPDILHSPISIHSTARVETSHGQQESTHQTISIHSTARVETHEVLCGCRCSSTYFNPLHREGGDRCSNRSPAYIHRFQSTPPRGWRRETPGEIGNQYSDFNPLHREGGDDISMRVLVKSVISIHSTARVETMYPVFMGTWK